MTSITTKLFVNYFYDVNNGKNKDNIPRQLMNLILSYRHSNVYEDIDAGFMPNGHFDWYSVIMHAIRKENYKCIQYFTNGEFQWDSYSATMISSNIIYRDVNLHIFDMFADTFILKKLKIDWDLKLEFLIRVEKYDHARLLLKKEKIVWKNSVSRSLAHLYKCHGAEKV